VAGPSSSGKTTFIRRLRVQLQVAGLTPRYLSLDDYYVDRERTPRDARGELDFEALEALDIPLLRRHVTGLLAGERVSTSRYDFKAGKSLPEGGPQLSLASHEILMLEGIHGLNPALLGTGDEEAFRILVSPVGQLPFDQLSQVHSSDLRLLRRIVRDRHSRATTAEQTILRWPSVRDGERHHIFPYAGYADAVFDTSLVYELSVLKVYAERYLLEVPQRSAAYMTATRLLQLVQPFVSIYPDHVPSTSILREFIGGSGFEY
jgi:uridine kinase